MTMNNNSETKVAGIHDVAVIMRDEFGILVKDGEKSIRQVLQAIGIALKDNDSVHIKGYLRIKKNFIPKKMGRNPKTGESMEIAEHSNLSCKAGSILKEYVNK